MKSFKTTWRQIRRTPYQALTAVFMMTLTFLAISIFAFIIFGSATIVNYFESKPQVVAFFKDEVKPENVTSLENSLTQTGKIAHMKYVSKKEALDRYKTQNKDDPLLLDLVTEDILPASLEISTTHIEDLATVSDALKNSPYIFKVIYQKDVISTLSKWTNAIRTIGILLIMVLAAESVFIVVTIIGFKISQKREEIEIMKLLSATNWFIRWPFIMEGIIYGVLGTCIGWFVATLGLLYATPFLETFLRGIPVLPVSIIFLIGLLGGELLFALFLGIFSSFVAVFRYLK